MGVSRHSARDPAHQQVTALIAIWSFPFSLLAMSAGWIFTEMGRQPWLVFGLLRTQDGVSPNITGLETLISLLAFSVLYGALAVVEFGLILRAVHRGPEDAPEPDPVSGKVTPRTTVY